MSWRRILTSGRRPCLALVLPLALLGASGCRADGIRLGDGDRHVRQLAPGDAHVYEVWTRSGLHLVRVEQMGIDVRVEVRGDSDGAWTADSPFDRRGPETVLLGPERGRWTLTVTAAEPGAPAASYALVEEAVATSDPRLKRRSAALADLSAAGRDYARGTPEGRDRAAERYRRAAEHWRVLGDAEAEAFARHARGVVLRLRSDAETAGEEASRAAALWLRLDRWFWLAMAEVERGLTLWQRGRDGPARDHFERALERLRPLDEPWGEAVARGNLCLMELSAGRLDRGRDCYRDALPIVERAQSRQIAATVHTNLGRVLDVLGEPAEALGHYGRALHLAEAAGDEVAIARALNNMGVLQRELGEPLAAIEAYDRALEIFTRLDDRPWQARVLNNLGYAYFELGSPARAEPYYRRALETWGSPDRRGTVRTLINLALLEQSRGHHDAAEELHRRATGMAERTGDGWLLALSGYLEGRALLAAGRARDAVASLAEVAGGLARSGRSITEAVVRIEWGRALVDADRAADALAVLDRALELLDGARQPQLEAGARHQRARAFRALGRRDEALAEVARAIATVEVVARRVRPTALRATFTSAGFDPRDLRLELTLDAHREDPDAGHHLRALELAASDRARALAETLGVATDLGPAAGPAEPDLPARRDALRRSLDAKFERLLRETDPDRVRMLRQGVDETRRKLDLVSAKIHGPAEIHSGVAPSAEAKASTSPMSADTIAGLLDEGTVLLFYALGDERSYLWRVDSGGGVAVHELPPRGRLEELARSAHDELSAAGPGPGSGALGELARVLLDPVIPDPVVPDGLPGGSAAQRLVVMADGALHLVPFAALPDPGSEARRPLAARFELVHPPSLAVLAARQRLGSAPRAPARSVAIFADPVFGEGSYEPLRQSRREAEAIAELADPQHRFLALGADAHLGALGGPEVRGKSVLHLATHGLLDTDDPARSGLVLSDAGADGTPRPGFLGLAQIRGLQLDADLVVLSGCRTGRGQPLRGEGVMGLGHGFLGAGARAVVASLWQVEDRATAELMRRFYEALWQDGLAPAAALRRAQLAVRNERRWRDPYYWAGFVVVGDWRAPGAGRARCPASECDLSTARPTS